MKEKCGSYVIELYIDYKGLPKSRKKARKVIEKLLMALISILSAIYDPGYVTGGIREDDCNG